MESFSRSLPAKITFLSVGFCAGLLIISYRLLFLQIYEGDAFLTRSKKNFLRVEKTHSIRGNILDKNGIHLVTNRPVTNIYWHGTGKNLKSFELQEIVTTLAKIIERSLDTDEDFLAKVRVAELRHTNFLIADDIPFEQLSKIEEQFPNHNTIQLTTDVQRFYPYASYASHVLGYLGRLDLEMIGKMGLEKLFEDNLKGQSGSLHKTINSYGKKMAQVEVEQALAGDNIHTTIDIGIQTILEKIFPVDTAGTILIMDPEDGALLGVVSRPSFDPTMFLKPIDGQNWQELQEKRPFLNRAFNACYPPGSIFKLITVSAALEHNMITTDQVVTCRGYTNYGNRQCWCNKKEGHGPLSTSQAVAQSCNILFFEVGKEIDIDLLAHYAHTFGLGTPTNAILGEKNGLVPTRKWKRETKGEPWWQGETLSAAIGQSFLLVTPIQVARMIGSIFTGYLVKPRILLDEEIAKEPLAIKKETLIFLRQSMKKVVTLGSGRRVSQVKDIEIYAKTSTAQTSDLKMREMGSRYMEHGWFVGHFRYKENKPLVFVILLENVGSSMASTAVGKDFLLAYKRLIDGNKNGVSVSPLMPTVLPSQAACPNPESTTAEAAQNTPSINPTAPVNAATPETPAIEKPPTAQTIQTNTQTNNLNSASTANHMETFTIIAGSPMNAKT